MVCWLLIFVSVVLWVGVFGVLLALILGLTDCEFGYVCFRLVVVDILVCFDILGLLLFELFVICDL